MSDERALLAALADRPDDELTWLAYADWLEEQGGERPHFVRLLLDLARGAEDEAAQADVRKRFERLESIDPAWREQVVRMRAALPLRFRVTSASLLGPAVPVEMFERPMTILQGFLEQGTIRAAAPVLVHRRDGATVEVRCGFVELFAKTFSERSAGEHPLLFVLVWMGHREELIREPFLVTDR